MNLLKAIIIMELILKMNKLYLESGYPTLKKYIWLEILIIGMEKIINLKDNNMVFLN